MFDISNLTVGEVAKIEELSGQPITSFGDDERPKALAMAALAFVIKRREDPKYAWNDALGLPFRDLNEIIGIGQDDEVEAPADPSPGTSSTKKGSRASN